MAAPTIIGVTDTVVGMASTSHASTSVGDLVIVGVWERAGAGIPNHTLQAGFIELFSQSHNDGSTDGRLSVACKIATASGANSYTPYTSSVGTDTWSCSIVLDEGTFALHHRVATGVSTTGTTAPNPPSTGNFGVSADWLVIVFAGWHLTADQTLTPTAPTNYTLQADLNAADNGDLAMATRAITGGPALEDPGGWADNQTPNGSAGITVAIMAPLAAENGWTLRQASSFAAAAGATTAVVRMFPLLADSLLTASIGNSTGATVSSITDTDSNSWTASAVSQVSVERVTIGYAEGIAGSDPDDHVDVTVTFSASTADRRLVVCEWLGAATTSALVGTNSKNNASETVVESNTVNPGVDGCLFLGVMTPNTSALTTTPGTGFFEIADLTSGWQTEFDTQTTAAAKEATWTVSPADDATCVLAVFQPPAAGQTISVNQITETDTAQAVAWAPKHRLVGQIVETDTAQAVTLRRSYAVAQVEETDTAQAVTPVVSKTVAVDQVAELDTAQAVAWAPKHRLVGQVEEVDAAQAVTVVGATVVAVGQVEELDTAQVVVWAPKHRLVTLVAETDEAQTITPSLGGAGAPAAPIDYYTTFVHHSRR